MYAYARVKESDLLEKLKSMGIQVVHFDKVGLHVGIKLTHNL